jgi:hypothetical protein
MDLCIILYCMYIHAVPVHIIMIHKYKAYIYGITVM